MKLRFSIRDLLWLTLVVGMGVGWWIDHQRVSSIAAEWRGKYEAEIFGPIGSRGLSLQQRLNFKEEELAALYQKHYAALEELEKLREELAAEKAKSGTK
jgi:hypothetical protein